MYAAVEAIAQESAAPTDSNWLRNAALFVAACALLVVVAERWRGKGSPPRISIGPGPGTMLGTPSELDAVNSPLPGHELDVVA